MLITEESSDGIHYVGHNKCYDQVLIKKSPGVDLMGAMVTVIVTDTDKHYVKATPLNNSRMIPIVTVGIVMLVMAFLYVAIL